jgi:hypothetical protein
VNIRYELFARILGAVARIEKREDQLRRKTRDLRTTTAKCYEVDGGVFEHLLRTATNLPLKYYTKIKVNLTVSNFSIFITIHIAIELVDANSSISEPLEIKHMFIQTFFPHNGEYHHFPKY